MTAETVSRIGDHRAWRGTFGICSAPPPREAQRADTTPPTTYPGENTPRGPMCPEPLLIDRSEFSVELGRSFMADIKSLLGATALVPS